MANVNHRYLLAIYIRILVKRRHRRQAQDGKRRLPRWWVRPYLRKREELGVFHTLFQELREDDREYFFRFCRMSPESFDYIAYMVYDKIKKKPTNCRPNPITPEERLAVTLRYLANGECQQSIANYFRIGRQTVSKIIRETCAAIWDILGPIYVKCPSKKEEWGRVADEFADIWNFFGSSTLSYPITRLIFDQQLFTITELK